MAARKSCTHLTWAEAKAKVGGVSAKGGGSGAKDKKDKIKGGNTHDKMLAAKIISKKMNVSEGEQIANRQAAKLAKKDQERAAYLEQKREEEKLQKLQNQNVSVFELAKQQLKSNMKKLLLTTSDENASDAAASPENDDEEAISVVLECIQLQLDEILALESIYNVVIDDEEEADEGQAEEGGGEDDDNNGEEEEDSTIKNKKIVVCDNCQIDRLRDLLVEVEEGKTFQQTQIVNHPPISFVAQLIITNEEFGVGEESHAMCLLVKVTFPNFYPLGQTQHSTPNNLPSVSIDYCMIVDTTQIVNCNKVLESLGYISSTDMKQLNADMMEYITTTLLPDPCIYDVLSNWLPTNIYNYVTMN